MPGDGGEGDAIIFSSDWPSNDWMRYKSWDEAWMQLSGDCEPGDTVEVLPAMAGQRGNDYAPDEALTRR